MEYSTLIRKKDKGYQYIISYKLNGVWKQKSKQGFKKRPDAQKAMDEKIIELKNQLKNEILNKDIITFKDFSEEYKSNLSRYRELGTIASLNTVLLNFSNLNSKEISKITSRDIQLILDSLYKNGLKVSSIKVYKTVLSSMFNVAINDYKLLYINPVKSTKLPKDKEDTNKRAMSNEELNKLLNFLKTYPYNEYYYYLATIASKSGLRIAEILALTWDDVDFKKASINVNKQWKIVHGKTYGFGFLKSKNSNRTVPMPKSLTQELSHLKGNKIKNIDNRLFHFKDTTVAGVGINRVMKKYGFNITMHELRHTYATNLIASGIDFKTAAYILGHNVQQTMNTYSHVTDEMIIKAKNIIENSF